MESPKFNRYVEDRAQSREAQRASPTHGVLMAYDRSKNEATVVLSTRGSASVGPILSRVPCPITPGIQIQDPEPGRTVWVDFKDGMRSSPFVVSYLSNDFARYDWFRQAPAELGVPRFELST